VPVVADDGCRVVGYALPPATQPNLFEIASVSQKMVSILADIRDPDQLRAAFSRHQPEIVFHLAAQAEILPSYSHPVETYSTNVMGTVHLLEAVRQSQGVRAVVVVTSDKCYENRESGQAYREGDSLGGADPYSSSKGCAELVAPPIARPSSTLSITPGTARPSPPPGPAMPSVVATGRRTV
jgi:CDP-glucose 4,6-dehydratase